MLNRNCRRSCRMNKKQYDQQEMGSYFPVQYDSNDDEFGGFFDDIKSSVTTTVQKTIDSGEAKLVPYIGEAKVAKLGTMLTKQKESLVTKATDMATAKAMDLVNTKENQDSAISSGVQATAQQISAALIDIKDTYANEGIKGLFNKYPTYFYVTGGLTGLLLLKFIVGKKRTVMVKSANPMKGLSKAQKKKVKTFISNCKA